MIPLASIHSTETDNHRRLLKGGVLGFGSVAKKVVRQIEVSFPDISIVAVCDPDESCLASASRDFNISKTFRDADSMCAEPMDFVLVLSCNRAHAQNVQAAAARGLPIFLEKPIATDLNDADTMIEAVEKAGVLTQVNYSLRFNPAYQHVRSLCQAGEVGEILAIQCSRFRGFGLHASGARHPVVENHEASGGWVVHHACHAIDMMSWLGGEFERVVAHTQTTHPAKNSPEIVWGLGVLKSGATAVVGDSVCAAKQETLVVQGSQGQIILDIPDRQAARIRLYREGNQSASPEIFEIECGKAREEALTQFFDCVRSGSPSACSIQSARHSLAVAVAMEASVRSGNFVQVPLPGESVGCCESGEG